MSTDEKNDRIFKALAASSRRAMLDMLKDQPQTTGELCARFPALDRCTVMQHLNVLEAADLVIVKREGRERWNYLNPLPIKDHSRPLDRALCRPGRHSARPPQGRSGRVGRVLRQRFPPARHRRAEKGLPNQNYIVRYI